MATTTQNTHAFIPDNHVESLAKIEDGYWWYEARLRWAKRLIARWYQTQTDVAYADLGCGTGGFAKSIAKNFDISKVALVDGDTKFLKQKTDSRFEVYESDFSKSIGLPWKPNLVTCMDVVEHIKDDKTFLHQISELIQPKGLLVLSVPAHPALYSNWDRVLGHYRRYNKTDIAKLVSNAGFTIRKIQYMWSFLAPLGPYRKLRNKKYDSNAEFKPVPDWINRTLLRFSDFEYKLTKTIPTPFGTSVILSAIKQ